MARSAFISASGRNIGCSVALELARGGANVAINGRADRAACEAVAAEARATGVEAVVLMGDVGDPADAARLADAALSRFGTIDILVNNAGLRPHQPLLSITDADWAAVLGVNLEAPFRLARAFLPGMVERRWGRIVNFAGMNAIRGAAGYAHISAAKHGAWGLVKSIATEFGPHGITANVVSPGPIRPDGDEAADTAAEAARLGVPAGRTGLPADIGPLVALLCSEAGGFLSGQMIAINGGAET